MQVHFCFRAGPLCEVGVLCCRRASSKLASCCGPPAQSPAHSHQQQFNADLAKLMHDHHVAAQGLWRCHSSSGVHRGC